MSTERPDGGLEHPPVSAVSAGRWVTPTVSYVDPRRRFCYLCGRPIARRYWQAQTARGERVFCDPTHAVLYATYPLSDES